MAASSPADVGRRAGDSGELDIASIEMLGIKIDSFSMLSSKAPKVDWPRLVSPSIICKSSPNCSAKAISVECDTSWEIDSAGKSSTPCSSLGDNGVDSSCLTNVAEK